jgi:hypothetical protein
VRQQVDAEQVEDDFLQLRVRTQNAIRPLLPPCTTRVVFKCWTKAVACIMIGWW